MPTVLELKPEEWRKYYPGRKLSYHVGQSKDSEERRLKALKIAQKASFLLREKYGAKKVVLFGSLARIEDFSIWSDIDLAAWDIDPNKFFLAVAAVTGLSPDFKIDLVDPDSCSETMMEYIKEFGKEI